MNALSKICVAGIALIAISAGTLSAAANVERGVAAPFNIGVGDALPTEVLNPQPLPPLEDGDDFDFDHIG